MRFFRQKVSPAPSEVAAVSVPITRRVEITMEREVCVVLHQTHPHGASCPSCGQMHPGVETKDISRP